MRKTQFLTLIWLLMLFTAIPMGIGRAGAATYGPNPDVNYDVPNFTYSPPLRKFVDKLPLLGPAGANALGQYIPIAVADTTTYPGSDYYEIALVQYREQMHSDLPAVSIPAGSTLGKADPGATGGTLLRGYVQEHNGVMDAQGPHYLGPLIIATKDRPVRIKFTNRLPVGAAGDLFLPIDTEIMGAGAYTKGDLADPASLVSGTFTQNRATLHLHGGLPGWTSDGTAHQWITPAGDPNAVNYPRGMSAKDVPDMPVPGDGAITFMWPNQMSGRLMFYHDHAMGLTGPNVYAGEAAGYLLVDPIERALTDGTTPGVPAMADVPLVIQDRTFVPDPTTLAATDPLWDSAKWGGMGNFWMPHVYMPNQDPFNTAGATPYGRWDYGPWFWPVFPVSGPMPTISHIPELFMDTPLVNGTAYPYMEVDPTTYRFRILNASNDRFWNLQLYQADPAVSLPAAGLTEVRMVPATPNPAIPFPTLWQTQTTGMIPEILDSRPSGVPDPSLLGPAMIQIGTEGGLLPAPVLLPNTPVGFEQNKRNIVVLNVSQKNLFLAPAERADVIVDFSQYAGKTIILYNDSPAPVPAGDPRNDFYTNDPDQTANGGAPTTLAGFGPNTRTVMQFRVKAVTPAPQFAPSTPPPAGPVAVPPPALDAALATAFAATQDPTIVNGVTSRIQDNALPYTPQPLASITVTAGGSGYTSAPTVNFLGGLPGTGAAATAVVVGGKVTAINLTSQGAGYSYPPTIMLTGGGGFGATAVAKVANTHPLEPKTIQELFDPLGRMNATLGVELPFTSALIQTTIPLGFADPPTEIIGPNEIQLWKITHNGVDSHGIHFHLFNVQVVNRVGWDGAIRLPDPNEAGWKDTVRMNPLEDCIVAVKAKPPVLPYGQPDSIRPLDVTMPLGSTANFTNVDPLTGNAPAVPVSNVMTNFNAEYTWHCHLLGHEENDMMRVLQMNTSNVVPPAFTMAAPLLGLANTISWNDPTPYDYATGLPNTVWPTPGATLNNPANEIGFKILRAPGAAGSSFTEIGAVPANITTFTDPAPLPDANRYQVVAYNAAGSTASDVQLVTTIPAPSITTTTLADGVTGIPYSQSLAASGGITPLTWSLTGGSLPASLSLSPAGVISGTPSAVGTFSFTVTLSDAAARTATATLSITVSTPVSIGTATLPGGTVGLAYSQTVAATGGTTPYAWSVTAGALPGGLTLDPATGAIAGTPTGPGTFSFTVQVASPNGTTASQPLSITVLLPLSISTTTLPNGTSGIPYNQTVVATGGLTPYAWSLAGGTLPNGLTLNASTGVISGTPTTNSTYNFTVRVTAANGSTVTQALRIVLSAVSITTAGPLAGGSVGNLYSVTLAATGAVAPYTWSVSAGTLPPSLALSSAGTISGTPSATGTFSFTVRATAANGATGTRTYSLSIGVAPAAPSNLAVAPATSSPLSLSWTDNSDNETSFQVWRSVNNGTFTLNATITRTGTLTTSVGGTVTASSSVGQGNTYRIYIVAVNAFGSSAPSNTVTVAAVGPATPTLQSLTAALGPAPNDTATLTWTDVPTETSYTIQRSTNSSFTANLVTTTGIAANSTSAQDATLTRNVTYYFRVRAVNGFGSSGWSNVRSVLAP